MKKLEFHFISRYNTSSQGGFFLMMNKKGNARQVAVIVICIAMIAVLILPYLAILFS